MAITDLVEFESATGGRVTFACGSVVSVYQVGSESDKLNPPGSWTLICLDAGVAHYVMASYEEVLAKIGWQKVERAESAEEAGQ